jgi:hypothetical protein
VAKNEIPSDAKPTTLKDANGKPFTFYTLSARDTKAPDGTPLAPSTRAWTTCQLRVASNYAAATNDQQFLTLKFPQGKDPTSSSSSTAPYVIGAVAVVVIAAVGGFFVVRRRRVSGP